jgi:hypothetical protein
MDRVHELIDARREVALADPDVLHMMGPHVPIVGLAADPSRRERSAVSMCV